MAKQYICDRCGKIISNYTNNDNIHLFSEDFKLTNSQICGNYHYKVLDLCFLCRQELTELTNDFLRKE